MSSRKRLQHRRLRSGGLQPRSVDALPAAFGIFHSQNADQMKVSASTIIATGAVSRSISTPATPGPVSSASDSVACSRAVRIDQLILADQTRQDRDIGILEQRTRRPRRRRQQAQQRKAQQVEIPRQRRRNDDDKADKVQSPPSAASCWRARQTRRRARPRARRAHSSAPTSSAASHGVTASTLTAMIGMAVRVMRLPKADRICAAQSRLKLALPPQRRGTPQKFEHWMASKMSSSCARQSTRAATAQGARPGRSPARTRRSRPSWALSSGSGGLLCLQRLGASTRATARARQGFDANAFFRSASRIRRVVSCGCRATWRIHMISLTRGVLAATLMLSATACMSDGMDIRQHEYERRTHKHAAAAMPMPPIGAHGNACKPRRWPRRPSWSAALRCIRRRPSSRTP